MDLEIDPYKGVGSMKFGMLLSEIRDLFPDQLCEIQNYPDSQSLWDKVGSPGLQIAYTYQEPHSCITIQVSVIESEKIFFFGRNLLDGSSLKDVALWLKGYDDDLDVTGEGIVSYKYGFYLGAHDIRSDLYEPLDYVLCFAKGVHDYVPTEENLSQKFSWEEFLEMEPEEDD
jgi:hypothetical protein